MVGAKKAFPGRQVISLSGDGGLSMLMGDLLTAVQEKIPIKIAVFNNGSLGFVELEMKVEGLLDTYTNLKNPDFARVAASGNVPWLENLAITTPQERYPESGVRVSKANTHVVVLLFAYHQLAKGFALDIPWSWRLREGGE